MRGSSGRLWVYKRTAVSQRSLEHSKQGRMHGLHAFRSASSSSGDPGSARKNPLMNTAVGLLGRCPGCEVSGKLQSQSRLVE